MPRMTRSFAVLAIIVVIAAAFSIFAGKAAAGNPNYVTLQAPKTVSVNYTHCFGPSGNPLPCVTIDYSMTNNSSSTVTCQVSNSDTGVVLISETLAPGDSPTIESTMPYNGQKSVTLVLSCNGTNVPGETQKVRVLIN